MARFLLHYGLEVSMNHRKLLSALDLVWAALSLFGGIVLAVLAVALPLVLGTDVVDPAWVWTVAFGVPGAILLIAGAFALSAGLNLRKGKGQIAQTILSVLTVGSVPFGTALALYGMWVCWVRPEEDLPLAPSG